MVSEDDSAGVDGVGVVGIQTAHRCQRRLRVVNACAVATGVPEVIHRATSLKLFASSRFGCLNSV